MPTRPVPITEAVRRLSKAMPKDMFKEALKASLTELMEIEVTALCIAAYGERADKRTAACTGYRARELETRAGTILLALPRVRQGTYLPSILEPRQHWKQTFVQVVAEAYGLGVTTRKMEELVEAMGANGKSEVSRMAAVLDQQVKALEARRLERRYRQHWFARTPRLRIINLGEGQLQA
jgi:putative transposase